MTGVAERHSRPGRRAQGSLVAVQGSVETATDAERARMAKRGQSSEARWRPVRNGLPPLKPFARAGDSAREAEVSAFVAYAQDRARRLLASVRFPDDQPEGGTP